MASTPRSSTLSLLELNRLVRETIECELPNEYWVEAELSECRESRGHCYMELVQYEEEGKPQSTSAPVRAVPLARASAKCWASKWMIIRPYFERTTGQTLHVGMKVLLKVYAQFHEAYGFSWIVTDIDPTYTLGDMARRRQEIIQQLKEEGIFNLQKELKLPLFCQRIAVISSETAAGYGDFFNQLCNNEYGFHFDICLFPAIMQGEQVEQSIIAALNHIYSVECRTESVEFATAPETSTPETNAVANSTIYTLHSTLSRFDCVVIIRGGGATADMSGFDTLALAENVANFPLPIITGIGHDRDESILDMVSFQRVKTPTAAAAFLIDHLKEVLDAINDAQNRISHYCGSKLSTLNSQLTTLNAKLSTLFSTIKARQDTRLNTLQSQIPMLIDRRFLTEIHRLQLLEEKAKSLDPTLLLQRGYSITLKDGKVVRRAKDLQDGDIIETRLYEGTVRSTVIQN